MTAELPLGQSEKYPSEKLLLTFDFTPDVPRSVSVASVVGSIVVTVQSGAGASAGDITVSGVAFSGKKVRAFFEGGVAGATYKLSCKANMSDGQAPLEIHGLLYIKTV